MKDFDEKYSLFQKALNIPHPWYVEGYELDQQNQIFDVYLDFERGAKFVCSHCGHPHAKVHDILNENRAWRHLDFWQYTTVLHARIPRTSCELCKKIRTIYVDWSRPGSGFTLLFESELMQLMTEMPVAAAARKVGEHDTRLWRVFHYYVEKAMQNLDFSKVKRVAIDETSSRRGHKYVTLFVDVDTKRVLFATEGKGAQVVTEFANFLKENGIDTKNIEEICSDMSPAFKKGVEAEFPKAHITFDKFHVMKLVNEALDEVRRIEQKESPELKRSRYLWLKNQANLKADQQEKLLKLKDTNLKTARAYRIKLALQDLWTKSQLYASFYFQEWYDWAIRSQLEPMIKVAQTLKQHEHGILR